MRRDALAPDDPRHGTYNGYLRGDLFCYRSGLDPAGIEPEPGGLSSRVSASDVWARVSEWAGEPSGPLPVKTPLDQVPCGLQPALARQMHRSEVTRGYRQVGEHGKYSSYSSGCRCDECREARNVYERGRWARARQSKAET